VPVLKFGWTGLISFCGRAELGNSTPVGEWIASLVDPENMRDSRFTLLGRLRDGASQWLSKINGYKDLSIVLAGFDGRSPFAHLLSNVHDRRGVRLPKASPQLERVDLAAKSAQVLCFGDVAAISTERRLKLARGLETSDVDAARGLLAEFNVERWASNVSGTVGRECVVGTVMPTGTSLIEPYGIGTDKEYMPQFVVNEFAAIGEQIVAKTDGAGKPLPIIWRGVSTGTSGAPGKGRAVYLHEFHSDQVIKQAIKGEKKTLPYNTASFQTISPMTGKSKLTAFHGEGNELLGVKLEYFPKSKQGDSGGTGVTHVMTRKLSPFRFAVGSLDEYRSAIWQIWTQRDEIYLACRFFDGWMKISIHKSGVIRQALTSESGLTMPSSDDRVLTSWTRAQPFQPGWTVGITVLVPHTETVGVLTHLQSDRTVDICWTETPPFGHCVEWNVLLQDPGRPPHELQLMLGKGDRILKTLTLRTKVLVHVHQRISKMQEHQRAAAVQMAHGYRAPFIADPGNWGASQLQSGSQGPGIASGAPQIVDLPMGKENLNVQDAPMTLR
jgi:hypothetical protein